MTATELQIRPDQTGFDDKQIAALRALGVQNAPPADVALLFHQAARTGLDPFARQIYLIGRAGKYTIQTGIDGFRVIRDRSHTYRGHTEEWCGPDGKWRDVWLDTKNPAAAKVSVHVAGYDVPIVGIARWSEYAQETSPTWKRMPALMLAKCAEALALRKAYPQDLSGLYTDDEIPTAETGRDGVPSVTRVQTRQAHEGGTTASNVEVAEDWIERIKDSDSIESLDRLFKDAKTSKVLTFTDQDRHTVGQWFNRRHTELEQDTVEAPILEPELEDAEIPF